jgi:hypothetical protein
MEWRSLRVNDWSNDNLQVGDLVQVWSPGQGLLVYNRPEVAMTGIVLSLNKPPVGSLQIYDAQILIEGTVVNVYRQNMYRITDDGDGEGQCQQACKPATGVV